MNDLDSDNKGTSLLVKGVNAIKLIKRLKPGTLSTTLRLVDANHVRNDNVEADD